MIVNVNRLCQQETKEVPGWILEALHTSHQLDLTYNHLMKQIAFCYEDKEQNFLILYGELQYQILFRSLQMFRKHNFFYQYHFWFYL